MERVSNEGIISVRRELFVIFVTCLAEFSSKANHFFLSFGKGKGGSSVRFLRSAQKKDALGRMQSERRMSLYLLRTK